jgi:hypothetical protein
LLLGTPSLQAWPSQLAPKKGALAPGYAFLPSSTLSLKVRISIPAQWPIQNDPVEKIVPKSGKFSSQKNVVSKHHVYHAIHHNFTTKTPQSAHRFSQKPLQKHHSATAKTITADTSPESV